MEASARSYKTRHLVGYRQPVARTYSPDCRCQISDQVWSPENNAHSCAIIRAADIYVLAVHCHGDCVRDAFGRAELLFSVDQACAQSASHRLVTVLAVN